MPPPVFKDQHQTTGQAGPFAFTFDVVQGRTVRVYLTAPEQSPNEVDDLQDTALYTTTFNAAEDGVHPGGAITFNTAPASGSLVTIIPDGVTNIAFRFSNTTQLNQDNLNLAYSQQSTNIADALYNVTRNTLRYNFNENDADINYENVIPPLPEGAFWRRGTGDQVADIVAQDTTAFINEVADALEVNVTAQVNAGAGNTNLSAEAASNPAGTAYSGSVSTVNPDGEIITGPPITGFSALAGAHWAQQWATSIDPVTDDYGNSGNSARFYAQRAADVIGGSITELRIHSPSATTTVQLIDYSETPNVPWENVEPGSLSVYVGGARITEPSAYSPPETPPPAGQRYTIDGDASPPTITFTPAVAANTDIFIARGESQGAGGVMSSDGSNAMFNDNTLVADRSLTNATLGDNTVVASRTLGNVAAATGRTSLGLGTAATSNTGIGANNLPTTAQADARYLVQSEDLSDVNSASTARDNLGLGSIATMGLSTGSANGGHWAKIGPITMQWGSTSAVGNHTLPTPLTDHENSVIVSAEGTVRQSALQGAPSFNLINNMQFSVSGSAQGRPWHWFVIGT